MEGSGQLRAPAALSPGRDPPYPMDGRLGERQSKSVPHEGEECLVSVSRVEPKFAAFSARRNTYGPISTYPKCCDARLIRLPAVLAIGNEINRDRVHRDRSENL
jgi:hypothetical protein